MDYGSFTVGLILGFGFASYVAILIIKKLEKPHGLRCPERSNVPLMPKKTN